MTLIAIYHLHLKIITRGKGASAVASAAYRSGSKLHGEYDGTDHDYTRKGGVVHTEILLPSNAPAEYADRSILWNAVEKVERYKNAQLAREVEVSLPVELTLEQNISLVRRYVQANYVDAGMVADVAVHVKNADNPHAHIMLTMRPFTAPAKPQAFGFDETAGLVFLGPVDITLDEMLDGKLDPAKREKQPSALDCAKRFIGEALTSGDIPAAEIRAKAEAVGISKNTLERAKSAMGISSEKRGDCWVWRSSNGVATAPIADIPAAVHAADNPPLEPHHTQD